MGDINLNDLKNKTAAQELVQTDPEELRAEAIKEIAEKKKSLH